MPKIGYSRNLIYLQDDGKVMEGRFTHTYYHNRPVYQFLEITATTRRPLGLYVVEQYGGNGQNAVYYPYVLAA